MLKQEIAFAQQICPGVNVRRTLKIKKIITIIGIISTFTLSLAVNLSFE